MSTMISKISTISQLTKEEKEFLIRLINNYNKNKEYHKARNERIKQLIKEYGLTK